MLGAAQSDAVGAEVAGVRSVLGGVGVGTDPDSSVTDPVGPGQQGVELGRRGPRRCRRCSAPDLAGPPVDRDLGAGGDEHAGDRDAVVHHGDVSGADDRWDAPAPCHHGGVAGETPAGGQDSSRRLHAEHVVGGRLAAHEDDVLAAIAGFDRRFGVDDDPPRRRPGRRRQAGGQQLAFGVVIVEAGVQVLRE